MPNRRSVLAGIAAAPVAAYLPWPVAEQWEFRWSLGEPEFRPWPIVRRLECLVRFPDGHTQSFLKLPTVGGNQQRIVPITVNDEMSYQVRKRAREIKRDVWMVWRKRQGLPGVDSPASRDEMIAFSEDLTDMADQLNA